MASTTRLVKHLPASEYHAREEISKHGLDDVDKALALFHYNRENPKPPSPAMRFGELYHTCVLESERFKRETIIEPDKAPNRPSLRQINAAKPSPETTAAIEFWNAWDEEAGGRTVITADESATLLGMRDALYAHSGARRILEGLKLVEPSLFWKDKATGVKCRARFDGIHRSGIIPDLKTCEDASPQKFAKDIWNYRYFVQAPWYADAMEIVTGEKCPGFVFIAQEKKPPYLVALYVASPDMMAAGRLKYRENLDAYALALESNKWPGYPNNAQNIDLPAWAVKSSEVVK